MTEADWAEAVAFANVGERPGDIQISGKDLAAMSALDQYQVIRNNMRSVNGYGSGFDQADYLADMFEPNLTEAGRLAFIERCIDYPAATYIPVVIFAQCQADIDAFDKAKLAQQISADKLHPGEHKLALRLRAYTMPARLKEHAAKVQKVFATDAGYKKLWDAAASGRAAFASTLGKNAELLALATRMDSAFFFQSRKMYDGCEAPTQEALTKIISSKVPASMFKGAGRDMPKPRDSTDKDDGSVGSKVAPVMIDIPELAFITGPYAQCHKKSPTASFLTSALYYVPGYRGPRRAALTAMTKEKVVLDDMKATIDYPKAGQPYIEGLGGVSSAGGVVKSVRVEGDVLLVSLEKLLVKREECVQSHRTNRVTRINGDGSLSYELICDKMGSVTYDDTPADFRIEKKFQPLLKKGVQFSAVGSGVLGAVLAIWPKKGAPVPTIVLGAEVK
jgi:hypothetical protein